LPLSDTPADFDLREQLARIDRAIAETGKLQEETQKFVAEQRKLLAEAAKLQRDRMLAPGQLLLGGFAAGAGMFTALFVVLKWWLGG
jgi:hypothetical protein